MISVIYSGNQSGVCFKVYESIIKNINQSNRYVFNLQQMNLPLILENGYHSTVTDEHQEILNKLEQSDTLIFIYPLY